MSVNPDAVEEFLHLLEPGPESSKEQYNRLRRKLIIFFEWKGCDDAAGLADETIVRVVASISRGAQIEDPSPYVLGIATNVFRESLRQRSRHRIPILEYQVREPEFSDECSRACFDSLTEDKRSLLEAYYSDNTEREALAQTLGISLYALRLKVHRIKAELRSSYRDCMEKNVRPKPAP